MSAITFLLWAAEDLARPVKGAQYARTKTKKGDQMSKPRYRWWGYIRQVILAYPELKKEYDALHQQSVTANMSGMPGGGQASRGTENIAIREMPHTKQKEYDAVRKAIEITQRMPNGSSRLRMIEFVYWKSVRFTVEGAAMKVGYSPDRGKQIHGEFVRLVAKCYGGLMDYESNEDKNKPST